MGMSSDSTVAADMKVPTLEEIDEAANRIGMYFTITWLGPVYRCVIRMQPVEGEKRGKAIGFTTGSIVGSLIRQVAIHLRACSAMLGTDREHGAAGHDADLECQLWE